jgi:hypothetical protein
MELVIFTAGIALSYLLIGHEVSVRESAVDDLKREVRELELLIHRKTNGNGNSGMRAQADLWVSNVIRFPKR